jgi:hypothetical protein
MQPKLITNLPKVTDLWTYAYIREKTWVLSDALYSREEDAAADALDYLRRNKAEVRLVQVGKAWFPKVVPVEYE